MVPEPDIRPRIAIPLVHSQELEYAGRVTPHYAKAVEQAGGVAVVLPLELPNHETVRLITTCDGVLLPGSRADVDPEKYGAERDARTELPDPHRDNVDELLLQDAYNMRKPVLGICFGLQMLNVWRSGTLVQHIESAVQHWGDDQPAPNHRVLVDSASLLGRIVGSSSPPGAQRGTLQLEVNSSHHQAVQVAGDGLRVVARCPQDGVIEALEGTSGDHFVLAVQWHPERMIATDPASRALFRSLVQAARDRHQHPRNPTRDFEDVKDG
jgi:putative glutamine amidotransferase